jgi:hypothetical protein
MKNLTKLALNNYLPGRALNRDSPISVFQVVSITGMNHWWCLAHLIVDDYEKALSS